MNSYNLKERKVMFIANIKFAITIALMGIFWKRKESDVYDIMHFNPKDGWRVDKLLIFCKKHLKSWCEGEAFEPEGRACRECVLSGLDDKHRKRIKEGVNKKFPVKGVCRQCGKELHFADSDSEGYLCSNCIKMNTQLEELSKLNK